MEKRRLIIFASTLLAALVVATGAYRVGYVRGGNAKALAYDEFSSVASGAQALAVISYLEAGRRDDAIAALAASVDAGIAAHWMRLQIPSRYAESPTPSTELVEELARYRQARSSKAHSDTPNLNRAVSEYLAHRQGGQH